MQQRAQSYLNVKCFKSVHPLKLLLNNRIFASCKIKKRFDLLHETSADDAAEVSLVPVCFHFDLLV